MAEMPAPAVEGMGEQTQRRLNLTECAQCENAFSQDNLPKLLPCLHTCCQTCISSQIDGEDVDREKGSEDKEESATVGAPSSLDKKKTTKPSCPACHQEFKSQSIISNPFITVSVNNDARTSEDGSPSAQKFPFCTSCDDNQKASSFCIECQEWLCDPCVIAHKRVRITKDHTFSTKQEQDDSPLDTSMSKQVYCPIHKTEKMKIFCLSCDKLTCRDCQLLEHKDHKYQFIEETIADQKTNLQKSIESLKDRLQNNEKVANKIATKEKDIKRQQVDVFNEVRQVADQITNDLIRWCKQLLNFLQGVCNCRTRDLSLKKQEYDDFAEKAKHCIEFVEYVVDSGNDMNILSLKGLMDSQLKSLLDKDISIQDSMFELNIKYENDVGFLKKNVSKMGFINVNGKSYPTNNQNTPPPLQKPEDPPQPKPAAPAGPASSSITPTSISRAVAELLNMYPVTVKENYKSMNSDQRRVFLQKLVTGHIKSRGPSNSLADLASYLNLGVSAAANQRSHNSDSNAIQELYRMGQQRPQQPPRFGDNPMAAHDQSQRPPGGPPPNYRGENNQPPVSSPTAIGPFPGAQPAFNWLSLPGSRPQNYYYNRPNPTMTSPNSTVPSSPSQVPQMGVPGFPPNVPRSQPPASKVPTAAGVPQGRFNIDPLNLRLKQEPRDDGQFGGRPSCQYSSPATNGARTIQSPTSSVSPILRRSPATLDGGQRASESPALPDVNVMDSDRNAILQNLNQHPGRPFNVYNLNIKHDPSDPSEDYCAVCHNGGDLLCCDRCPKVFHLQCHIPAISASLAPSAVWSCTMCQPEEDLVIETPVVKEFEVTSTGKRKAPSGLTDKELKACERVLLELFCLETSTCFHEPVSKQVPNYYKIITNPMDFGSIKCKLRRGHFNHYNTIEEFLTDIKLVFKNCYKYNSPASEIYGVGKSIEAFFETVVQTYLPCYLDFIHRDIPSPAGSAGSLEPNGDAPRQKKRRSPAPDASRDSPVHIS